MGANFKPPLNKVVNNYDGTQLGPILYLQQGRQRENVSQPIGLHYFEHFQDICGV